MTTLQKTTDITAGYLFLEDLFKRRLKSYFENGSDLDVDYTALPHLNGEVSTFSKFVKNNKLNIAEYVTILLAFAPHFRPNLLDNFIQNHLPKNGNFPEIGGVSSKQFRGFLPSGETAIFLLAGNDISKRFQIQGLFDYEHFFYKNDILVLEEPLTGEPRMSGKLMLSQDYVELFSTGKIPKPKFSQKFPAREIDTQLEWADLVLSSAVKSQIKDLMNWIQHNDVLMNEWEMGKRLRPGYVALFHGPPGTGKTMTAGLLGKYTGRDVFKIDLSTVVSKYIGETEKNLSSLFDKAENKKWILFFDEADALFGKRTGVRDAHDKYANQEVSYLLQRIEQFSGLIILASNIKSNIDDAFLRRFNETVHFPMPDRREREEIWRKAFPRILKEKMIKAGTSDLFQRVSKYELSGGHIINAVQYACLKFLGEQSAQMPFKYVLEGVKREIEKTGGIFSE